MAKRTCSEVIDQAIKEGRDGLILAYVAIGLALIGGIIGFCQAIIAGEAMWVVGSSLLGICLWPALRHALKIRRQNVAIRLLEIPLDKTTNAEAAARLLQDFFRDTFFRKD